MGRFIMQGKRCTLFAVTLSLGLVACSDQQAQKQPEAKLRSVRTVQVQQALYGPYQEFTAVVDASQKVDLAFKVSGRIIELPVKSGDEVKQGQLIAQLDDTDLKVQLSEAQSSYEQASSDFERAKKLIGNFSISQSDFDQFKARYNSATAQLENAQNKLSYTKLYASFDGVIATRYVENFQEIAAQAPIAALHDLKNISFKVDIPESIIIKHQRQAQPPKIKALFDSIADKEFPLTFKEISTQADEITKTFQATFIMPAPENYTILPGMTARVRVMKPEGERHQANFYLPSHAVLKDSQGHFVYTVAASDPGQGVIRRQAVTIGNLTSLGIEVFTGIESQQHVITAGMSKVSDGMIVRFQP